MQRKNNIWTVFLIMLISSGIYAGDANTNPIVSAKSLALGGYYYAGSDDITTAFLNPAKIFCSQGVGFAVNIIDRAGRQQLKKENGDIHRSYLFNDFSGSAGIYWVPNPRFGLAAVYNRALDYSVRFPFVLLFTENNVDRLYGFQLKSRIIADAFSPVIGLRIGALSFGAAINVYQLYQQFGFPISNSEWLTDNTDPVYALNLKQNGSAVGWSFGFIFPLTPSVQIGGGIRSGVKVDLEGNAKTEYFSDLDSLSAKSKLHSQFNLPLTGGLGILLQPTSQLRINLDFSTEFWKNTPSALDFNYSDTAWTARMAEVSRDSITGYYQTGMPFYNRNGYVLAFGLEYSGDDNLKYRFGYAYQISPNSNHSSSLLFPNVSQHWISTGIGFIYNQFYIDITIAYSLGITTRVRAEHNDFFAGKYDTKTILPALSIKYRF